MTPRQQAQRDAIMARAQQARVRWTHRTTDGFKHEMGAGAAALEALAQEVEHTGADLAKERCHAYPAGVRDRKRFAVPRRQFLTKA